MAILIFIDFHLHLRRLILFFWPPHLFTILIILFILCLHNHQQPLSHQQTNLDHKWITLYLFLNFLLCFYFSFILIFSSFLLHLSYALFSLPSISKKFHKLQVDLNYKILTVIPFLANEFISFFIYFLFDINFFNLDFGLPTIFVQYIARR